MAMNKFTALACVLHEKKGWRSEPWTGCLAKAQSRRLLQRWHSAQRGHMQSCQKIDALTPKLNKHLAMTG